jgi:hypothetical protein
VEESPSASASIAFPTRRLSTHAGPAKLLWDARVTRRPIAWRSKPRACMSPLGHTSSKVNSSITIIVARSNTPSKKYGVLTVCFNGRSKAQLSFVLIHMETLRTKIPVVSRPRGPPHCFPAFRGSAATTGAGMVTGAALRRGQAAIPCSNRRTHLGEVTAHRATAARAATLTAVWSSLVDAGAASEMASH